MATVRVEEAPFDVAAEMAALTAAHPGTGGIGCFVGIVRPDRRSDGRSLLALTLEHYPGMTERSIGKIVGEAEQRFALTGCTVLHRVGRLAIGEGIVLVLAAAPHRGNALDATAFLIDWLKTRAPFWKRQDYDDGGSDWVEARAADDEAADRWS